MRYLILILFLISCDNEKVKIDKALENCATFSYIDFGRYPTGNNQGMNLYENSSNEFLVEQDKDYQRMLNSTYSLIPSSWKNSVSDLTKFRTIKAFVFSGGIGRSKFSWRSWAELKKFRAMKLREKIEIANINEKKKLVKFLTIFEVCENERLKKPKTFMLRWGEG